MMTDRSSRCPVRRSSIKIVRWRLADRESVRSQSANQKGQSKTNRSPSMVPGSAREREYKKTNSPGGNQLRRSLSNDRTLIIAGWVIIMNFHRGKGWLRGIAFSLFSYSNIEVEERFNEIQWKLQPEPKWRRVELFFLLFKLTVPNKLCWGSQGIFNPLQSSVRPVMIVDSFITPAGLSSLFFFFLLVWLVWSFFIKAWLDSSAWKFRLFIDYKSSSSSLLPLFNSLMPIRLG